MFRCPKLDKRFLAGLKGEGIKLCQVVLVSATQSLVCMQWLTHGHFRSWMFVM